MKNIFSIVRAAFKHACQINQLMRKEHGQVALVTLNRGLGDVVVCEPIFRYILETKHHKMICMVRSSCVSLCEMFPSVDLIIPIDHPLERCIIAALTNTKNWYNPDFRVSWGKLGYKKWFLPKSFYSPTSYNYANFQDKGTLLEVYSEMGGLPRLNQRPVLDINKGKFSEFRIPEGQYIALQTQSGNPLRTWSAQNWKQLVLTFPNVQFVEINTQPLLGEVPNCDSSLCGKLTVADIALVIDRSIGFIGTDSSCAHYASALRKKSLIIMSQYYHWINYNPFSGIENDPTYKLVYFPCEMQDVKADDVIDCVKHHFFNELNNNVYVVNR